MLAVSAERMESVRAEAFACRRCDLWHNRTLVVFGEGNLKTSLMLVGEAPGETEDHTGHPFVGRAGKILSNALKQNQIDRSEIWITNAVRCRPINLEDHHVRNRPPRIGEIRACTYWTEQQIEIIKPPVILCLGVHSASTLIHPDFKITKERGQWFTGLPAAPAIMATLHPAYILRLTGNDYEAAVNSLVNDIMEAKKRATL